MTKQDITNLIASNSITTSTGQVILTSQEKIVEGLIHLIETDVDRQKIMLLADVHDRLKGKVERMIISVRNDHGLE